MSTEQRRYAWVSPYFFVLTLALLTPADVEWNAQRPNVWLSLDSDLWGPGLGPDVLLNVAIFAPIGFALHGLLRTWQARPALRILIVVLAAGIFSLTIESLQYLLAWRHSSLIDVFSDAAGAIGGLVLDAVSTRASAALTAAAAEVDPAG